MKSEFRWTYNGFTGPFHILKGDIVVATIQGLGNNPNDSLPLVAEIVRVFAKHARKIAKEQK